MKNYRGKLETIYDNPIIQEYLKESNGIVGGYLGHENRTDRMDQLLENTLKDEFGSMLVNSDMIARWICSKNARHFMDECEGNEYFQDNVMEEVMEF